MWIELTCTSHHKYVNYFFFILILLFTLQGIGRVSVKGLTCENILCTSHFAMKLENVKNSSCNHFALKSVWERESSRIPDHKWRGNITYLKQMTCLLCRFLLSQTPALGEPNTGSLFLCERKRKEKKWKVEHLNTVIRNHFVGVVMLVVGSRYNILASLKGKEGYDK